MEIVFDCPNCNQELQVDASAAGTEIQCPTCSEPLIIPTPREAKASVDSQPLAPSGPASPPVHSGAIAASAAAREIKHFVVPQHKVSESLIEKPKKPLEVAAKETDRRIRIRTIRHTDCIEVGKDRYDEIVSDFLHKVGRENIISISPINYTHMDMATRNLMSEYGLLIVYMG